jgi:hypothetical protein
VRAAVVGGASPPIANLPQAPRREYTQMTHPIFTPVPHMCAPGPIDHRRGVKNRFGGNRQGKLFLYLFLLYGTSSIV